MARCKVIVNVETDWKTAGEVKKKKPTDNVLLDAAEVDNCTDFLSMFADTLPPMSILLGRAA